MTEKKEALEAEKAQQLRDLLDQAWKAYDADDSKTVSECCDEALAVDPNNPELWELLAKFGGWNSQTYEYDQNFAITAARRAVELAPISKRYKLGAEIYVARKKQIAKMMEAHMMMPSHTSARRMHQTMEDWMGLLQDLPYLSPGLIEAEVNLCKNLCLRSKMGIMPNDRLVYVSYATFNNKESYGDTFERKLSRRIEAARAQKEAIMEGILNRLERERSSSLSLLNKYSGSTEEQKTMLEEQLEQFQNDLGDVLGMSDKDMFLQQRGEVEAKLAELGPMKIFKRKELREQLDGIDKRLAEIDGDISPVVDFLVAEISAIQERLVELD